MPARSASPAKSIAPWIVLGSIAVAGTAIYYGYPGLAAIWAGLVAAAWMEQPPVMSGPKVNGRMTPGPGEDGALARYRMWSDLRMSLVLPSGAWPWPMYGTWIGAVLAAALAWFIPVQKASLRWIDVAAAFIVIVAVASAHRSNADDFDDCPGTTVTTLPQLLADRRKLWLGLAAGLAVAIASTVALLMIPAGKVNASNSWAMFPLAAALSLLIGIARPWQELSLAQWREMVRVRAEWAPRWANLKYDPAPRLIEHRVVGELQVDTFDVPGGRSSAEFLPLAVKLSPAINMSSAEPVRVAVLESPVISPNGPMPGTIDPNRFVVVTMPGEMASMVEPQYADDLELALLIAHFNLASVFGGAGWGRPVPVGIELISAPGQPSLAWRVVCAWPNGASNTDARISGVTPAASLPGAFGCDVLIDSRIDDSGGGEDAFYIGDLGEDMEFLDREDNPGRPHQRALEQVRVEDAWTARWKEVANQAASFPIAQHPTAKDMALADGTVIHQLAFVTRVGMDPAGYQKLEPKLATSLLAAPFVSVTGYPGPGSRPGERHPMAIAVRWSESPVPESPAVLAPSRGSSWVLSGYINSAFDVARLARPEISSARALTGPAPKSPGGRPGRGGGAGRDGHIWEIALRLYGGVTLDDVRSRSERLRTALNVPWLRVASAADGCVIFCGALPGSVSLSSPSSDGPRIQSLDWEQAWLVASVKGSGGQLPKLTEVDALPSNPDVSVLTFALPPGLDLASVRAAAKKLMTATGNEYVEIRQSPKGPAFITVLASVTNPMPASVAYDFDGVHDIEGIPFATGVEGIPISWNTRKAGHTLVAGVSGGGKSVLAQAILFGAFMKGYDVVVIDPTKGAADFTFVKDHALIVVGTNADRSQLEHLLDSAAAMKAIYAEVIRRKTVNSAYGVGTYFELPEEVRPRPILIFIDEFAALLGLDRVQKQAFDDPEMEAERQDQLAMNNAKMTIGQLSSKIAAEARSGGVHLALGTQKLSAKMLDDIPNGSVLKANLARILLGKASQGDIMSAMRIPDAVPSLGEIIPPGRGIWEPLDSASVAVQAWYASQDTYREQLNDRLPPLEEDRKLDIEPFMARRGDDGPQFGEYTPDDAPARGPARPAPPVEIDLGTLSLSMDDFLDEDDDEPVDSPQDDEPEIPARADADPVEPADSSGQGAKGPAVADPVAPARWEGPVDAGEPEIVPVAPVDSSRLTSFDFGDDPAPSAPPAPVRRADPEPEPIPDGPRRDGLAVLLDIEGSLIPAGGPEVIDPALAAAVSALGGEPIWLTDWQEAANLAFGEVFGRELEVLAGEADDGAEEWWKLAALDDLLARRPDIVSVIWVDAALGLPSSLGFVTRAELAEEACVDRGVRFAAIVPDPGSGVTADQLAGAEAWLQELEAGSAERARS